MRHQIMDQLASVRPADLAPGRPADPGTRDRELTAAFGGAAFGGAAELRAAPEARGPLVPAGPPGSDRAPRPSAAGGWHRPNPAAARRRGRRRLVAGLAAAVATAAAVAVAVTLPTAGLAPDGTRASQSARHPARNGHQGTGTAPVSARQALRAAARSAVSQQAGPAGPDRYWFTDIEDGQNFVVNGRGGRYVIQERDRSRDWTFGRPAPGAVVTHYWGSRILGVRPYGAANVAAWHRDGSPTSWAVVPEVSARPGSWVIHKTQTSLPAAFNDGSLAQLRHLPASAARLRAFFLAHQDGSQEYRQPGQTRVQWLAAAATYLLRSEPVPGRVRAAAFRMLAGLPGIRSAGPIADPLGRRGIGILIPASGIRGCRIAKTNLGSTSEEIIVDPAAGRILATEVVVARPGTCTGQLPAGSPLGWTVVRKAAWTNHTPRHAVALPG